MYNNTEISEKSNFTNEYLTRNGLFNKNNNFSKSWTKVSIHRPLYSGGKITVSHRQDNPFILTQYYGDIIIIDVKTGTKIGTLIGSDVNNDDIGHGDHEAITSFCLSPNDATIITAHRNLLLKVFDLKFFFGKNTLKGSDSHLKETIGRSGHDLPICDTSFHPSGNLFATGSVDSRVTVWDYQRRYVTHIFRHSKCKTSNCGLKGSVTSLHWCQNLLNIWLSVGREDGSIHIHDLNKNSTVIICDHLGAVSCAKWNNECDLFLSTGKDEVLHTYSIREEQFSESNENTIKQNSSVRYHRLYTLPIYELIVSLEILPNFKSHSSHLLKSQSDLYLATCGSKGVIRIWKASRENNIFSKYVLVKKHEDQSLLVDDNGYYIDMHLINWEYNHINNLYLVVVDSQLNFTFLNLSNEGNDILNPVRKIAGNIGEINDLKIIPDGNNTERIAVATNCTDIKLFNLDDYNFHSLVGHTGIILCLAVSPCGHYLITCSKDKTIRLWHTQTYKCLALGNCHSDFINTLALSQKKGKYEVAGACAANGRGAFVISGSKDRTIKRWNLPGKSVLDGSGNDTNLLELSATLTKFSHEKDINVITVAPNDTIVCTGSQDKTAKLWNASDLSLIGTLNGHKRSVFDCKFSNQYPLLATSSGDLTVKLWSVPDKSCIRTFQGHSNIVLGVLFLPNGLQLFSSGGDGLIKLWNIKSNSCELTLDVHNDRVWAMDLSSDGKILCTAGADAKIVVLKDSTVIENEAIKIEQERSILMEQKLTNHVLKHEYELALDMALTMFKPMQTLNVLVMIIENQRTPKVDHKDILISYVKSWSVNRIIQVLHYCRDWNTLARNCNVAMLMLRAIVSTVPAQTLAAEDSIKELMEGIIPYTERHYDRIDGLKTDSHIIDYFLKTSEFMDEVYDLS